MPCFKKGTINIGDRQRGRLRTTNVTDCEPDRKSIGAALSHLSSDEFQRQLPATKNLYGGGRTSGRIVKNS